MFYNGYDFGGEFIPTSYMKIKSKWKKLLCPKWDMWMNPFKKCLLGFLNIFYLQLVLLHILWSNNVMFGSIDWWKGVWCMHVTDFRVCFANQFQGLFGTYYFTYPHCLWKQRLLTQICVLGLQSLYSMLLSFNS
jgi:hypothetical protein